jgi:hypothetical protein
MRQTHLNGQERFGFIRRSKALYDRECRIHLGLNGDTIIAGAQGLQHAPDLRFDERGRDRAKCLTSQREPALDIGAR